MKVHVKKCWPDQFAAVLDGSKPFEWRREDDCTFDVGDLLLLFEWDPGKRPAAAYTGRRCMREITYVLRGEFGVPVGYVVLGLAETQ